MWQYHQFLSIFLIKDHLPRVLRQSCLWLKRWACLLCGSWRVSLLMYIIVYRKIGYYSIFFYNAKKRFSNVHFLFKGYIPLKEDNVWDLDAFLSFSCADLVLQDIHIHLYLFSWYRELRGQLKIAWNTSRSSKCNKNKLQYKYEETKNCFLEVCPHYLLRYKTNRSLW